MGRFLHPKLVYALMIFLTQCTLCSGGSEVLVLYCFLLAYGYRVTAGQHLSIIPYSLQDLQYEGPILD